MKVLKFGGTSVGTPENIQHIYEIVNNNTPKIVVLSAMSGSTNSLVKLNQAILAQQPQEAQKIAKALFFKQLQITAVLLTDKKRIENLNKLSETLYKELLFYIESINDNRFKILAQGERFSTYLVHQFLEEKGIKTALISALDFMRIDKNNEPDMFYIRQNLRRLLFENPQKTVYITQGFICRNHQGDVANLDRGGSDYSATLIGAALYAEEVQIWTDIDGFHNNDPRYINNTYPLANLSYNEAAELAYFGAKILHPQTILPVKDLKIPVRLKNTQDAKANGTLITHETTTNGIKAIAAKDGITAIKIKSERMLLAYGFLKKVFEIFEKYQTPIDMITTSEIAISLTIDNPIHLAEITKELQKFASVEIEQEKSIICLVGNEIIHHPDTPQLFKILNDVNIRMIAYGGSNNNISLLVNTQDKISTLNLLNNYVFRLEERLV
ncbi:MAG: aspartate kinase [Mesonia hippocampi]|uniref:aspartate kinase n=1 Tax=Mesonia hippocampi TaxID=1628250 RepID=UPI003F9DBE9A